MSNLALSSLVILILGFVLTSQVTDRILESKIRVATEEMERARVIVSDDVGGEKPGHYKAVWSWPVTSC